MRKNLFNNYNAKTKENHTVARLFSKNIRMIAKLTFFWLFIIKSEDLQASSIQLFNFILSRQRRISLLKRFRNAKNNFFAWLLNPKKSCFDPKFCCIMHFHSGQKSQKMSHPIGDRRHLSPKLNYGSPTLLCMFVSSSVGIYEEIDNCLFSTPQLYSLYSAIWIIAYFWSPTFRRHFQDLSSPINFKRKLQAKNQLKTHPNQGEILMFES